MTIFELIRSDHKILHRLLDDIGATKADSPERELLFTRLLVMMQTHAIAEEQSLYTALMGWPELTEHCRHYTIQHAELDELADELKHEDMSRPGWKIKFYRLRHAMVKHMEEEERQMLPRAEQLVSPYQADCLRDIYRSRQRGYPAVA